MVDLGSRDLSGVFGDQAYVEVCSKPFKKIRFFSFLLNLQHFSRPPKGEIIANTTGGTRKYKGRLDTATTPPAEASGVSGAMPTVRKEEGVVLVRDRVRVVRSGRGVAG